MEGTDCDTRGILVLSLQLLLWLPTAGAPQDAGKPQARRLRLLYPEWVLRAGTRPRRVRAAALRNSDAGQIEPLCSLIGCQH